MNRDESCRVAVIIPALNEAETTRTTIQRIPYPPGHVIVADNGSRDGTPRLAAEAGARVLRVPHRGYGRACLAGIDAAWDADVLVFLDADLSEDPGDIPLLVGPIARGEVDLVLGARTGQSRPWHARAGTALCVWLINRLWGRPTKTSGPSARSADPRCAPSACVTGPGAGRSKCRSKRQNAPSGGWRSRWRPARAAGRCKISGSVFGTIRAAGRMLEIILRLRLTQRRRDSSRPVVPTGPTGPSGSP